VGELGVAMDVEVFERTFHAIYRATVASPDPADAAAEFAAVERDVLLHMGANFAPLSPDVPDPAELTRVAYAALALDSLTPEQVAANLGRTVSRIHQRTRERTLWSVATEPGARYPRVQFEDDGNEIGGMGPVLRALPPDLHPIAELRWLTLPKADLRLDGTPVSPRDWLRAGGQAEEAIALAEDLHVG
jgi:hypothetical protein